MESLDQDFQYNAADQLQVTRAMRQDWQTTGKWAFFLSIIGFVFIGLGLLVAGSLTQVINMMQAMGTDNPALELFSSMGTGLTIFYLLMLALQLAITYFHFRFAQQLKRAVQFTDQDAHEQAWLNFRNFLRINGIVFIVVIVFYIIAILSFGYLMRGALSG